MLKPLTPSFRGRARRRGLLASSAAAAAVAALLVPVEVAGEIEGPARVQPSREWVVARSATGAVSATLRDRRTGAVEATVSAEPARGDAVRFELRPAAAGRRVRAGDTLGSFVSGATRQALASLDGQLREAEAALAALVAGDKADEIEALRQDARRAHAALDQAKRVAARQRELVTRGVVAAETAEQAEAERASVTAAAAAAEARVRAALSGARVEEVSLARARVEGLRREAGALEERASAGYLIAPISGLVYRVLAQDTLMLVVDTSAYTALVPVRWSDRSHVRAGHEVTLSGGGARARARIVDLRDAAAPRAGQAFSLARAEVYAGGETLAPGLLLRARIETTPQRPFEHARRLWADLFNW